ncbi:hypothetical protein PM082_021777 [Marasmius tenuissimus]|nr:hypothetical protein PM082_021777 [Marasmius tenuissimus]
MPVGPSRSQIKTPKDSIERPISGGCTCIVRRANGGRLKIQSMLKPNHWVIASVRER